MRARGIVGLHLRKKVCTTISAPRATPVPDLVGRDFTAAAPNTRYVGDITYLPIAGGQFLYLATVLDLYSKRLAGWSIADHMRTQLVIDALRAAAATRGEKGLRGAVFHSDNGAQGGFDWSSQHPDLGGVWRGHGGLEFEDQRCSRGGASAVAC
jgi:transposase InsO family protein